MCLRSTVAITRELTTHIEAGEISCFYEGVKANQVIDVEYQVIDGGHGDLDISFALYSPNNIEMVQEYKKPDNIHRLTAHTSGDHKFCYDNSFSRFNRKTVFFEIIIESEDDTQDPWNKDMLKDLTPDETLHEKVSLFNARTRVRRSHVCSFVSGRGHARDSDSHTQQFE